MNYAELQARIAAYMHRSDLAADIPGFIDLAESRINTSLRTMENEAGAVLAMTASPFPLPADYAALESIEVAATGGPRTLQRATPTTMARAQAGANRSGGPRVFLVQSNLLTVAPFLGSVAEPTEVSLAYWSKLAPLVADDDTNAVLERWPQLYLLAALIEAYWFIGQHTSSADALQRFVDEINITNTAGAAAKWGAAPAVQAG
jgi:hypothetical protein